MKRKELERRADQEIKSAVKAGLLSKTQALQMRRDVRATWAPKK